MNKLIFLICNVFLASLLFIVNPAQASSRNQIIPNQQTVAVSVQPTPELTTPTLNHQKHTIINHVGCGCAACMQANFNQLQGKLPLANF